MPAETASGAVSPGTARAAVAGTAVDPPAAFADAGAGVRLIPDEPDFGAHDDSAPDFAPDDDPPAGSTSAGGG